MIEHHVSQSVAYTGEGVEQMGKALRSQKHSRRVRQHVISPLSNSNNIMFSRGPVACLFV